MEEQFTLDHDRSSLSRRSALKSGAALAGAGVATLVLPAAANAASFGATPTGQAALGGVPTAVASNGEFGTVTLNITWRTTGYQDVNYSYVWYYNDTTPRSMGGSGTASGYLAIDMGPLVEGMSTARWSQSNAGDGKTISFYIVDPAGVKYKFENKYSTDELTFISY